MNAGLIVARLTQWFNSGCPPLEPRNSWPAAKIRDRPVICPSQSAENGTLILGEIDDNGQLQRLPHLVERWSGHHPESSSTRFAGECVRERCAFWAESCQLAAAVIRDNDEPLPPCPLRSRCRWFLEHGAAACSACSQVTYKMKRQSVAGTD